MATRLNISKTQSGEYRERKISTIHQAAIKIPFEMPPPLFVVHGVVGKGEQPNFNSVRDQCGKNTKHNTIAIAGVHARNKKTNAIQKFVVKYHGESHYECIDQEYAYHLGPSNSVCSYKPNTTEAT